MPEATRNFFNEDFHGKMEILYFGSQIILVLIATLAAIAARKQLIFMTYFELTKFLQEPKLRRDRRTAYNLIESKRPLTSWNDDERDAVSNVFSSFDVVGMLATKSLVDINFFAEFYKNSIIDVREGHLEFLMLERRSKTEDYWKFMEELYNSARSLKARFPSI